MRRNLFVAAASSLCALALTAVLATAQIGPAPGSGGVALSNVSAWLAKQTFFTSTTSAAAINIPEGSVPSAPVNGDMWTTTAGLFVQIGGATVGPLSTGGVGCTVSGTVNQMISNNGSSGCQTSTATLTTAGAIAGVTSFSATGVTSSGAITAGAAGNINWTGRGILSSPTGGDIQLGGGDAATAIAQTLSLQSATTAGNAGANGLVNLSKGATTGAGGDLTFQCAPTGTIGYKVCFTLNHLGVPVAPGFTVSTLPASPPTGSYAYVTDAVACTFLSSLTGGGSTFCPVNFNGASWVGG